MLLRTHCQLNRLLKFINTEHYGDRRTLYFVSKINPSVTRKEVQPSEETSVTGNPYNVGDAVRVRQRGNRCHMCFTWGNVTKEISHLAVEVDGMPRHVHDLCHVHKRCQSMLLRTKWREKRLSAMMMVYRQMFLRHPHHHLYKTTLAETASAHHHQAGLYLGGVLETDNHQVATHLEHWTFRKQWSR